MPNSLELTRRVAGPPEKVWQAWTEPDHLARWWWPPAFRTEYHVDARAGGSYRFRAPDVTSVGVLEVAGTFLEIDAPHRLLFTWRWEPEKSVESRVEVAFEADEEGTALRVNHSGLEDEGDVENHIVGWNDCIDRLERLMSDPRSWA